MTENPQKSSTLSMLAFEDQKSVSNLKATKESRAENNLSQRSEALRVIQKNLLTKLSSTSVEKFSDENERVGLFQEFSKTISDFFPEIKHYQEKGQTASEFSPKPVEVEHKKTVASIQYLLILTSEDTPIQDTNDIRFKVLVPTSFQTKFSPKLLEEQRQIVTKFLDSKDKVYLMSSILAVHDMAKLGSIAETIKEIRQQNGELHTTDHDIALQALLNSKKHVSNLLPTVATLPEEKQKLIKAVLKAGSEINIGQIGQALEGNPSQLEAISRVDLSEDDMGFWFMENLCDTATAAGSPDGSALIMSQENVWKAWKWSVNSLLEVKSGKTTPVNAYLDLLENKAQELNVPFNRSQDQDIAALRICMALQTTSNEVYEKIYKSLENDTKHLMDVFGLAGMAGEISYRLYYSPSILRKVNQISGLDQALQFMDKIAGACKKTAKPLSSTQGELTFQLSPIDALINPKMQSDQLQTIIDSNITVDDQLYVRSTQ